MDVHCRVLKNYNPLCLATEVILDGRFTMYGKDHHLSIRYLELDSFSLADRLSILNRNKDRFQREILSEIEGLRR